MSVVVTLNNFSEMGRKLFAFMQRLVLPKAASVFSHVLYVVNNWSAPLEWFNLG